MSEDRRTRQQLIEEIEASHAQIRDLTRRIPTNAEALKTCTGALAACVSALDGVDTRDRMSSVYGARNTEVEWVVRALCDRYGVPREREVMVPCARPHVDDLSPQQIGEAIRGAVYR